jgi:hypothetical protein
MSDEELVKRLRKLADDMEKHAAPDWDEHEDVASAADRIEALKANLAKAIEIALEDCPYRDGTESWNDWWHDRRATLAEIEGEKT